MGFLDKIKILFKKEKFLVKSVSVAPSEETKEEIQLEKTEDPIQEQNQSEEIQKLETEITTNKEKLLEILNAIKINMDDLALDKMQGEAETISSYVKGLIKDLSSHQDFLNEKDRLEQIIKSIGGKIKVITNHSLELKNLLASLEDHYHTPIIQVLKNVNEESNKEEIQKLITDLENDLNLVKTLETDLTKVIGYNELFNPDKNPQYKDDIEKEAKKRIVHGDLNKLIGGLLNVIIDRSLSVKTKIEKINPIESAKKLI